ncbi:hypothetical protein DL768_002386 [Monosporascus sp. mg162]|nr:hypothetical protein DL768_002386 [Monosporascus sp. mg162]
MADGQEKPPCRILVMASGNGSNFQALISAVAAGRIPSSRIYFNLIGGGFLAKGGRDEARVREARERYDAALAQRVLAGFGNVHERPELVVLAGWMHVFGRAFLEPLQRGGIRVINLHPRCLVSACIACLPAGCRFGLSITRVGGKRGELTAWIGDYNGAGAIERAFEDFKGGKTTRTGISVHYVILEMDMGAPILVREIEFREGGELAQLEERIHGHEHELIVEATAKVVG